MNMQGADPDDENNLTYLLYVLGFVIVFYLIVRGIAGEILSAGNTGAYLWWWQNPGDLVPIIVVFAVVVVGFQFIMAQIPEDKLTDTRNCFLWSSYALSLRIKDRMHSVVVHSP